MYLHAQLKECFSLDALLKRAAPIFPGPATLLAESYTEVDDLIAEAGVHIDEPGIRSGAVKDVAAMFTS